MHLRPIFLITLFLFCSIHLFSFASTKMDLETKVHAKTKTLTDPPTAVCVFGLAIELDDDCSEILTAQSLNYGSSDDVTDEEDLIFEVAIVDNGIHTRRGTQIALQCSDIGNLAVAFIVIDEENNESICNTVVKIKRGFCAIDHSSCPPVEYLELEGTLGTKTAYPLDDIDIFIDNQYVKTVDYEYAISLPKDENGEVGVFLRFEKEDRIRNGVNTLDLILIRRHILRLASLDPEALDAADVNMDDEINIIDMIMIRQAILGQTDNFNGVGPWYFTTDRPQDQSFFVYGNGGYYLSSSVDELKLDFTGIKLGDVNGDLDLNRSQNEIITIKAYDRNLEKDQEFCLDFKTLEFNELIGYQFTLEFDPEALDFKGFENLNPNEFSLDLINEGMISVCVNIEASDASSLVSPIFVAKKAGKMSELLEINSDITEAQAYDKSLATHELILDFETPVKSVEIFKATPNPFSETARIEFVLQEEQTVNLEIYNVSGKMVYQKQNSSDIGSNVLYLKREDIGTPGIYFYKLKGENFEIADKLIMK